MIEEQGIPAGAVARLEDVRVDKPWGYELRFAITDRYLGKVIHVNRGEALSLQYHDAKDETLLITSGVMDLELEDASGAMQTHRLVEGNVIRIVPGRKHRMNAVEDCEFFEVSSPEIHDVVRLEDRYGRQGTTAG
ncbi:MAG: mannose-6-phosphate isomerase [Chloroflexota bacterium]|jgi:mannose-6-phosphate isomerase-like protein (cupin superfamily)|nr:mannose-6-phosphate isomerase [Chloroflexota bacterium]